MITRGEGYNPALTKNQNSAQIRRRIMNLEKMAKDAGFTHVPAEAA
jgi:hypothetical protein